MASFAASIIGYGRPWHTPRKSSLSIDLCETEELIYSCTLLPQTIQINDFEGKFYILAYQNITPPNPFATTYSPFLRAIASSSYPTHWLPLNAYGPNALGLGCTTVQSSSLIPWQI